MPNDGKSLEDDVYKELTGMLDRGDLPYLKERCRLHRKKSYYSPDRKADVEFENVIEVFVKDNIDAKNPKPTHVVIFECKDHGRNVEVGKVDEFIGRLNLSFGFSTKGYIVTRKGFSSGAFETAASKGVGLIKIMPEGRVSFLMYHMTHEVMQDMWRNFPRRAALALLNENYESNGERFYAIDNGKAFASFEEIIKRNFI